MISPEAAKKQLDAWHAESNDRVLSAAKKLPAKLRTIALPLLDRDAQGKPLGGQTVWREDTSEVSGGRSTRRLAAERAAQAVRRAVRRSGAGGGGGVAVPEEVHVSDRATPASRSAPRAIRRPRSCLREGWLTSMLWIAEHLPARRGHARMAGRLDAAPGLPRRPGQRRPLLAAVIDAGGPTGDEVFDILCRSATQRARDRDHGPARVAGAADGLAAGGLGVDREDAAGGPAPGGTSPGDPRNGRRGPSRGVPPHVAADPRPRPGAVQLRGPGGERVVRPGVGFGEREDGQRDDRPGARLPRRPQGPGQGPGRRRPGGDLSGPVVDRLRRCPGGDSRGGEAARGQEGRGAFRGGAAPGAASACRRRSRSASRPWTTRICAWRCARWRAPGLPAKATVRSDFEGDEGLFERLERLFQRLPPKPVTLKPLVWPWTERKASREDVAWHLVRRWATGRPRR